MDIRSSLRGIAAKFEGFSNFVTEKYYEASTALQGEVAEILTGLAEQTMRPVIGNYIAQYGQKGFDRLVLEDRDLLVLIEKYRPSYLFYINRAKKVRNYIRWDNRYFADNLALYLREQGISVGEKGYDFLVRTCERFRAKVYST